MILLWFGVVSASEPSLIALRFPLLAITNASEQALPLFSLAAYRAEFRYLQGELHRLDLTAPGVRTDGWTSNVAEAEWPFMTCAYCGYAGVNLAKYDTAFQKTAFEDVRWFLEAMSTPRLSGFMDDHFGPPFTTNSIRFSVFVHGHWLQLALRYREMSGDTRYDKTIHRVARALSESFGQNAQGILKSYKTMWWLSDNLPALSALCRYDVAFGSNYSVVRQQFLKSVRSYYLDSSTGLMATYITADTKRVLQGPRGISTMYGLHFLPDVDPGFARQQYAAAQSHFVRTILGVTAVREFPEGVENRGDIDSGPLFFGLGPSASGFAIAACALAGDDDTAWKLAAAAVTVGLPKLENDELRYTLMPPVGQAVILFGKTLLLK